MSEADADAGLTVQADSDSLEGRTLDILFDLRKDTTTLYRQPRQRRISDLHGGADD
jgi:hypothetical protein